jgi:hypothetical protein
MVMQQAGLWLDRGKTFFGHLRAMIMAPPAAVQAPVWYSGLGIEPTEFSGQLARLQMSLSFANGSGVDHSQPQCGEVTAAGGPVTVSG